MAADSDIMAQMAARLMGGPRQAPPVKPSNASTPSPAVPRTLPAPSPNGSTTPATFRPQPSLAKTPEVKITPPSTTVAPSLTFSPTTIPSPTLMERDMNANRGPALRGDPTQLKAARQFMNELSGGKKGSHGRPKPSRHDSMSSTTSSVRSTKAHDMPSPRPGFSCVAAGRPTPPAREITLGGWQGFSSSTSNKQQAPAISSTQPKALSASSPILAVVRKPSVQPATSGSTNTLATPAQQPICVQTPATPVKQDAGAGLLSRQMASVNTTLTSNTNSVPPHLRKKADAGAAKPAALPTIKPTATQERTPQLLSATDKAEKKDDTPPASTPVAATDASGNVELEKEIKIEPKATQGPPMNSFAFSTSPKSLKSAISTVNGAPLGTPMNPIDVDAPFPPSPSTSSNFVTGQDDAKKLVWIIAELQDLKSQVKELETENLELNQKAERLQESEERRKFLGTDDARAPFTISIQNPHGQTHAFQASKEKKIKQLILDARFKFKLDKDSCKAPTLSFKGKQVGHAMMMGEIGVVQGSTLAFNYAGADDEEL
ncbi:hypothetical protein LTR78_010091 [Recurvomyces mirabilis]|uniref:Uncharacterized protein n=1 Tax=Recurvomyces mirabilis TaxID=574656 RepID=A0AAE0WI78_9PEZI|nr:hypothetical protein LTR78_010091 [Recurvomyces mirabilis]KAK5159803.1 hypothetical protein LTS14_001908 [Recurvomyces mirabilis]